MVRDMRVVCMSDVLEYIRRNPGSKYQNIREDLGLSGWDLTQHLDLLVDHNDIIKVKSDPKEPKSVYQYFSIIAPCSHLLYALRLKTKKWEYHCTSEDDLACSCCPDGWCPIKGDKK
jgi:hypothetical protein